MKRSQKLRNNKAKHKRRFGNRVKRRKEKLRQVISQHWRVRSVIQPNIKRKEIISKFPNSGFTREEKGWIRIPSISWYIQNCILPKKSRKIQETIEKYLKDGGVLFKNSLPKKLISKRKSLKGEHFGKFGENLFNLQNFPAVKNKKYGHTETQSQDRCHVDMNPKLSAINPELKNLNLQAAQKIIEQRVFPNSNIITGANIDFFQYRQANYKARLNTAA